MIKILKFLVFSVCFFAAIIFIDKNNLTDKLLENAPSQASAFIRQNFQEARLNFSSPSSASPIALKTSNKGAEETIYQYIYPSQIFYVSTTEIKLLFHDSVFTIYNGIGLKKMKEQLESRNYSSFLYTQTHIINKTAICSIAKENKIASSSIFNTKKKPTPSYIRLLNNDLIPIGREKYKELTKEIDLANKGFSF